MRSAWIMLALLLSSCGFLQQLRPVSTPEWAGAQAAIAGQSAMDELATYLGRLQGMGETALASEARRQRQAASRTGADDATRVKAALAILLAHPAEDAEVLALVEPLAKRDSSDAQVRAMASFLQAMVSDRRRLRESAAAANAKLREERRTQESLKTRAEAAQERATQLQERATQLQQKLDALTELEKSLSEKPISSR